MRPSWIKRTSLQRLVEAFPKGSIRFVGGCVRDSLLRLSVHDIDLATPYSPNEVISILRNARIKTLDFGIKYGTITAILDKDSYQITTLRNDIRSYGRSADVSFTTDWKSDASRRDFTINAIYLSTDGEIIDYFGGLSDLAKGKIKFIGSIEDRIKEDFLRILRFFRFHISYGRGKPSLEVLNSIKNFSPSLQTLSKERIREELLRILSSSSPTLVDLASSMEESLCFKNIFGLTISSIEKFKILKSLELEYGWNSSPLLRLAILFHGTASLHQNLVESLKLSNQHRDYLGKLIEPVDLPIQVNFYKYGKWLTIEQTLLSMSFHELNDKSIEETFNYASRWYKPNFPLVGNDLKLLGFKEGEELGKALKQSEKYWIENNFFPKRYHCLNFAKNILRNFKDKNI